MYMIHMYHGPKAMTNCHDKSHDSLDILDILDTLDILDILDICGTLTVCGSGLTEQRPRGVTRGPAPLPLGTQKH